MIGKKNLRSLVILGPICILFHFCHHRFRNQCSCSRNYQSNVDYPTQDGRSLWESGDCEVLDIWMLEVVVIAVHSPEFKYESDVGKVKSYIQEHRIPYAVPIDNEFRNWRGYRNRYWPTLFLIDKRGNIQYTRIGEGSYEETEKTN